MALLPLGRDRGDKYRVYRNLIDDTAAQLGVDNHDQIIPRLDELERKVQDLRWFVAEVERIAWEDEIIARTVKVRKQPRNGWDNYEDLSDVNHSPRKSKGEGRHRSIKVGRTCSKGYEETLERLREWSYTWNAVSNMIHHVDDDHVIEAY